MKEVVRDALTAKLLQLGPGSLQRARTGSVQSAMVDGVELLDPLVGRFLPQAVASALGALAVAAYVFVLDPLVGAVVLACALAAPAVVWGSERLMDARASAWTASYRALYAENLDALQGMATLKAFNASRTPGVPSWTGGPGTSAATPSASWWPGARPRAGSGWPSPWARWSRSPWPPCTGPRGRCPTPSCSPS